MEVNEDIILNSKRWPLSSIDNIETLREYIKTKALKPSKKKEPIVKVRAALGKKMDDDEEYVLDEVSPFDQVIVEESQGS
jgi:hypothetical protein